jgi:hypothetical protein
LLSNLTALRMTLTVVRWKNKPLRQFDGSGFEVAGS